MEWKDKKIGVRRLSPAASSDLTSESFTHEPFSLSPLSCTLFLHGGGTAQALERQKEYTDAIRTERDELREEVVKLKDVLKVLAVFSEKHGGLSRYSSFFEISKMLEFSHFW